MESTTDVITEAANAGTDRIESNVCYSLNSAAPAAIENRSLLGSGNLTAVGTALANKIAANLDHKLLEGLSDSTSSVTGRFNSYGGASFRTLCGTDIVRIFRDLAGSSFNDILGGDGNDNQILGGAGDNLLTDEPGNDTLVGDRGDDALDGGYGFDAVSDVSLLGTGFNANLTTGIITSEGTDTTLNLLVAQVTGTGLAGLIAWTKALDGSYTDFALFGGEGHDMLTESNGEATLDGGQGADLVTEGSGYDVDGDSIANFCRCCDRFVCPDVIQLLSVAAAYCQDEGQPPASGCDMKRT